MKQIFALALAAMMLSFSASAESVKSLRDNYIGDLNETPEVSAVKEQDRFDKNYRQQPPLIPHKIDKYEVDLKVNQCLSCHDWNRAAKHNAPKVSETHFVTREGYQLDTVARTRWFCTQCHVPQSDAKELVKNTFEPTR